MAEIGKRILWHGPGSRVPFGKYMLEGMVYVSEGTGVPCVLDPKLDISTRMPIPRETKQNPSYATLSPEHRNMLLKWHQDGRVSADIPTGLALMHLFSLERRLLAGNPAPDEAVLLRREIRRLLRLFESNATFRRLAGALLEEADRRAVMNGEMPILQLSATRSSMTAGLRLHIARTCAVKTPLRFEEAMSGWLGLGTPGLKLASAAVPPLVAACAAAWPRTFSQGLLLTSDGIPRLPQHAYTPAMWGLKPQTIEHQPGLPDPQRMDWRLMDALVLGVHYFIKSSEPQDDTEDLDMEFDAKPADKPTVLHDAGQPFGGYSQNPVYRQIQKPVQKTSQKVSQKTAKPGGQMAAGASTWLNGLNDHAELSRDDLMARMLGDKTPPNKRNLSRAAILLHAKGWGMEPDPLWAESLASKDSPAFVFRMDSRSPRPREISLEWALSILLWASVEEDQGRLRDACDKSGCTMDMRRRLRLCGQWWDTSPRARRARLKWAGRVLLSMDEEEEAFDTLLDFLKGSSTVPSEHGMTVLEDAAKAMGLGSPWSRVMGLEAPKQGTRKTSKTGKTRKQPSDVVMVSTVLPEHAVSERGIPAPPLAPLEQHPYSQSPDIKEDGLNPTADQTSPPSSYSLPVLDRTVLERVEQETRQAADILSAIWEDDVAEVGTDLAPVSTPSEGLSEVSVKGLTPAFSFLLRDLLLQEHWTAAQFDAAVQVHGLRSGAALETINEWSWTHLDAPLLEDGGDGGFILDSHSREAALLL